MKKHWCFLIFLYRRTLLILEHIINPTSGSEWSFDPIWTNSKSESFDPFLTLFRVTLRSILNKPGSELSFDSFQTNSVPSSPSIHFEQTLVSSSPLIHFDHTLVPSSPSIHFEQILFRVVLRSISNKLCSE
jgi:hypothetical protein